MIRHGLGRGLNDLLAPRRSSIDAFLTALAAHGAVDLTADVEVELESTDLRPVADESDVEVETPALVLPARVIRPPRRWPRRGTRRVA